jgi:hypothetical protein
MKRSVANTQWTSVGFTGSFNRGSMGSNQIVAGQTPSAGGIIACSNSIAVWP